MRSKSERNTTMILCVDCKQPLEMDEICFCQRDDDVDEGNSINQENNNDSHDRKSNEKLDGYTLSQLLIAEVRERPVLWNSGIPVTEKSPSTIAKIWDEIDKILDQTDYSRKRWRYLRNRYTKCLNDYKKQHPSGSGVDDCVKEITWEHFRSLEFLRPVVDNYRRTTTNPCLEIAENDDNPSVSGGSVHSRSNSAVTTDLTPKGKKRQRTASCDSSGLGASIVELMKRSVELPPPPPPQPLQPLQPPPSLDMVDSVTAFLGNVLRSLEPQKRMQLMHKMMQEAMAFQLQQQQEYADEYYY